jgi:Polysaccharide pyruvyl transferase
VVEKRHQPVILFGAWDRHNLGDLLFPHIAARMLAPRPVVAAGLVERDLTAWGGHRVAALGRIALEWGERPADVLHPGGEILGCDLYQAAVMTLPPDAARAAVARYDADPVARLAWARQTAGTERRAAYLAPRGLFRNPRRFVHHAVGGVDLARLPAEFQREVVERLGEADRVSVRDRSTQSTLAEWGIRADLTPDPAELVAELFGDEIRRHGEQGEPLRVREGFPGGYLALQFSADFGDDATLRALADPLGRACRAAGLGLVLFRAGAAPWHDDLEVYRRFAPLSAGCRAEIFRSLDIWDLCALLAGAAAYLGSSLHGRIVAEAFGVPGLSLIPACRREGPSKQEAYFSTWLAPPHACLRPEDDLARALGRSLANHGARADDLAGRARVGWRASAAVLGPRAPGVEGGKAVVEGLSGPGAKRR